MSVNKNIVVEVDEDGFVSAVYCPDETYVVDVLDRVDQKRNTVREVEQYYNDVEKCTENLKNCF